MDALVGRRLVVVAGKGGVGRTCLTAGLATAAARRGLRVCALEMSGLQALPPLFGLAGRTYAPRSTAEGVDVVSLTPYECMNDFGRRRLRVSTLATLLFRSRVLKAFIDAVPGLHDLLQLGKLENMVNDPAPNEPVYDLVVLDAPATGHGLTLLAAARSMREMTRAGPFTEMSRVIEEFLADTERTAVVVATLAEELPVSESLELLTAIETDGMRAQGIVLNQLRPKRLPDEPPWPILRAALTAGRRASDPGLVELVGLAEGAREQDEMQEHAVQILQASLGDLHSEPDLARVPMLHEVTPIAVAAALEGVA